MCVWNPRSCSVLILSLCELADGGRMGKKGVVSLAFLFHLLKCLIAFIFKTRWDKVIGLMGSCAPQQKVGRVHGVLNTRRSTFSPRCSPLFLLFGLGQSFGLWHRVRQLSILVWFNAFLVINLPIFIAKLRAKLYWAQEFYLCIDCRIWFSVGEERGRRD